MIYLLLPAALFLSVYTTAILAELVTGRVVTSGAKKIVWAITAIAWSVIAIHQGWVTP